jgi:MFS family permease
MALSEICLFAIIPLFYSTPIELGGMGFSAATIGLCMGSYGIIDGALQVLLFARIVGRLGPKRLVISSFSVLPFIFAMFPIINMSARAWGVTPLVWAMLYFQLLVVVFFCMSFGMFNSSFQFIFPTSSTELFSGAVFIYVTSSAPSRRSLGTVNGMAQTTVSITRAFGPASATSLFAYSLQTNWLGGNAVYLMLCILPVLALFFAVRLPRQAWKHEN